MTIKPIDEIRSDPVYFLSRLILLTIGSLVAAFSVVVFFLPSTIAPAGVTGLAVILRELIGAPIWLVILLANIPIQIIAFKLLGGWRTVLYTIYAVLLYSVAVELLQVALGNVQLTDDAFLNAVVGGVVGGIGGGLIYRAGGTVGGTSTIAQMLRHKFGLPLSAASFASDTLVILLAGIVLGWEAALYALVGVFLNRLASDFVLEGPSDTCTAIIITDRTKKVSKAVTESFDHGATSWDVTGLKKTSTHKIVMVSILRSQIWQLRHMVRDVDEDAFVTILSGQAVYGDGFEPLQPDMPLRLDEVEVSA